MTKKFIFSMLSVFLACFLCINVSAVSNQYFYEELNITIVFDDPSLDTRTQEHIANYLVYGASDATTFGLWCTLFGHSYEAYTATQITHGVRDTNPRCLEEIFKVQVCSRCEDTISELVASSYITCCPEE